MKRLAAMSKQWERLVVCMSRILKLMTVHPGMMNPIPYQRNSSARKRTINSIRKIGVVIQFCSLDIESVDENEVKVLQK